MTDLNSYAQTLQRLAMATAKQLEADHPHMTKTPSELLALAWYFQVAIDFDALMARCDADGQRIAKAAKLLATDQHSDQINDPTMYAPGVQPMYHQMKFTGAKVVSLGHGFFGAKPLWAHYLQLVYDMERSGQIKITLKS